MSELSSEPWPRSDKGGLLRTIAAASLANLSQRQFEQGCESGEIPVRIEQIGRLKFVRAEELTAWLAPAGALGRPLVSEQNLFT